MGGSRSIPQPDRIAREYILLALRLDQHIPGLVDGYYGPADLKAKVDMEQLRTPAQLHDEAAALRARLPAEVQESDRRAWLDVQLVALEAHAAVLEGAEYPYLDLVSRYFSYRPPRRADEDFAVAAARMEDLLPGDGSLADRLAAWDKRLVIDVDRLPVVVEWLVARYRERAAGLFGLPDGEDLRVSLVTNQPWSGYNWFDGGRRSRVDLNTDLPIRATELVHVVAHETYPGHHLEHAWKEADLVDTQRRLENAILLINTPECLISEGLADVGAGFVSPDTELVDLLLAIFELGGLDAAADPALARETAERSVALIEPRRALVPIRGNAAILRHADGLSHDEVVDYLIEVGKSTPEAALKRLEFIDHPLWRTYVFVYSEGEALLRRWLDEVPATDRATRFGRLLHEQLTPGAIQAELAASLS